MLFKIVTILAISDSIIEDVCTTPFLTISRIVMSALIIGFISPLIHQPSKGIEAEVLVTASDGESSLP